MDDCCGGCCNGCVVASDEKLSSDINPSFVSVIDVLIASETLFFKVSTVGEVSSGMYDTYTVTVPSSAISTTTSVGSIPVSLLTLFLIFSTSTRSASSSSENSNETVCFSVVGVVVVVGSVMKVDSSSNTFFSLSSVSIISFCNVSESNSGMSVSASCRIDTITSSVSLLNVIVISSSGIVVK